MFKVTFTADRLTEESIDLGASEENGYVNLDWNRFEFVAEEDEDTPAGEFETREEAEKFIEESIGYTEASGDSYYAADGAYDNEGNQWRYAGHIDEV